MGEALQPDLDVDDYYDDDELYEPEQDRRPRCGCRYCECSNRTEYGETCGDCIVHAHQG